ncbi:polymer-forming cytoskeletal protein [Paraclostridium sordellii]|uniref:polymer-forming cytoskeletal protein n=1 Tax=Paraclostridium sordellii TaxID=1505 RepID=UPI001C614851|nr:polymer-forming cytoskeletal protein [Paeniclostridium sordellii]QYE99104.1 polymer-forming cytoskeletal protein [Paeniclostridium sordellii]
MKELNFSNADITTEDNKLIFTNRVKEDDDIKIDNTAILLKEIETTKTMTANYSLITFDSLIGSEITVRNNLTCYGDIECEKLNVYGDLKCYGNINAETIDIKGDAIVSSVYIEYGKVDQNLFADSSLEIIKELHVKGNILCNEGIIGTGVIYCNNIYAQEYLEIETKGESINNITSNIESGDITNSYDKLLLKLQDSTDMSEFLNSIEYEEAIKNINLIIEEIDQRIPSLDNEHDERELIDILKKLSNIDRKYKFDSFILKIIDKIQDSKKIDDLYEYLKLINYKHKLPEYMFGLDLCRYTFNNFLDKQKDNIKNMNIDSIKTNEDFAKSLLLLESNKDYFTKEEYIFILGELYKKIGVALKLVAKNLNIEL